MNLLSLFRRRGRRGGAAPPAAAGRAAAEALSAASPAGAAEGLIVVPTSAADGRRAVDALAAAAAEAGLAATVVPAHRIDAVAAGTAGPILVLVAPRATALLDAMTRGVPPSVAAAAADAADAEAAAIAARHPGRTRLLDLATAERGALAGAPHPSVPPALPVDADPVLAVLAAAAAAGAADPALWDAAFHRHGALTAHLEAFRCEAAAWTRDVAAGADAPARLAAALAVREAEVERLAADLARLEAEARANLAGADRPRRHEIDIPGATVLHRAFYDAERPGDRPFRWFGREVEARIATTLERRRPARVEVTVEMAISRAALDDFRIGLDGIAATAGTVAPLDRGRVLLTAVVPGDPAAPPLARRELVLTAPTRVDMSPKGDRRTLAVAISRIVVEEIDDALLSATGTAPAEGASVRQILAERLTHPAFHGAERRGDGLSFRWMGRQASADLAVRLPRGIPVRITVRLAAAAGPSTLGALSLAVDGVRAGPLQVTPDGAGGASVSALVRLAGPSVPAGGRPLERMARLTLRAPAIDFSDRGDPRRLSIAVHAIRAETVPDAADEDVTAVPSLPPYGVAVEAAELPPVAFFDLETQGDRPFRWMGRSDRAHLPLAVPQGRPVAVTAELLAAIDAAALDGFTLSLGGQPADASAVERLEDGRILVTALFPPVASAGPVALGLEARHRAKPGNGDPRMLAVALSRLTVDAL
jgi:hypothetical protein